MEEVVCWCCEFFRFDDDPQDFNPRGHCSIKNFPCTPNSSVCDDFVMLGGLYTKRTVPPRCKNAYKSKNKNKNTKIDFGSKK